MDSALLVVTIVSLGVAVVMSAAAWRLAHKERVRAGARAAALVAAADAAEAAAPGAPHAVEDVAEDATAAEPVAVGGTRQAPWSSPRRPVFGVARTIPGEARTRADVRSSSVPRPAADVPPAPGCSPSHSAVRAPNAGPAIAPTGGTLLGGAGTDVPSDGRQRRLAVAAVCLLVLMAGGAYWTLYRDRSGTPGEAATAAAPLELVSLRHERRDGRLAITGLVRNPVAGRPLERLTAVVFLFDQQGAFMTSARQAVDFVTLTPGDESPFVVAVDAPAGAARYRVSFRNESGVVPHVDRRGQAPIALQVRERQ
jgi:hypothetical protein